jgi:hypothetical protein
MVGAAAVVEPASALVPAQRRAVFGMPLPGGLVCPVEYRSRVAWGADESYRFFPGHEEWPIEPNPTQVLTVHHSGFVTGSDPAATVRSIYRQQALPASMGGLQGWGDIGYHLLIDAAGVVYEGRYSGSDQWPVFDPSGQYTVTAAHALGYNTGNIGVCLLGYLNDSQPTAAARDALITVLAYLARAGRVGPLATVSYHNPVNGYTKTVLGLVGHRDWAATDCPGNAFYPRLGELRQQVDNSSRRIPSEAPMPSPPPRTRPGPTPTQPEATRTRSVDGLEPLPTATPTDGGSALSAAQPSPLATTGSPTAAPVVGGPDRGGDEYVAQMRIERPAEFPTVAPSPRQASTPSATPTPVAGGTSTVARTRGATTDVAVAPVSSAEPGPNLGLTAAAVGLTAAGALGAWWLRRVRVVAAAEQRTGPRPASHDASTDDRRE